jgi:hypothetical protein
MNPILGWLVKMPIHDETNTNGQRIINICVATNLRLAYTHFANRPSRQNTYKSPHPDHPPTQIDHITISTKWWKSLKACRSFNTVDIGSDHKIVTAQFSISFRATKQPPGNRCKFNSEKLLDPSTRIIRSHAGESFQMST